MKSTWKLSALTVLMLVAPHTMASAQTDLTVPGGATGKDVFCVQAGDLVSGAFLETFMQSDSGDWVEVSKDVTRKYKEEQRDELLVELYDDARNVRIQMDFVAKTIREKSKKTKNKWEDRTVILNATDKDLSFDCVSHATAATMPPPSKEKAGPGTVVKYITIAPRTKFEIKPGTELTATSGPACPGNPGFFLCPNKFNCAPIGGICCPGSGTCSPGMFCDQFVSGFCIGPANIRFCPGSGNAKTGISLHCPPGKSCDPGNICN